MSTHTQILYHIAFGTKFRTSSLEKENRKMLFKYFWRILKNNNCHVYRINGVEDHVHILTHVHPTVAVSYLVKDMKVASNLFLKEKKLFPQFLGWQKGYSAFTHHINDKNRLIEYIKKQEEHHQKVSWPEELKNLLEEHKVNYNEQYLV